MTAVVHIIGAGLAGLSAAVRLTRAGRRVLVHESAPVFGGRCRSLVDSVLGREIDNGNHMILSGNRTLMEHARITGGESSLREAETAAFPFVDLLDDTRWTLRPAGLWVFDKRRRVPGTRAPDYLAAAGALFARDQVTADQVFPAGTLIHHRLWKPLVVSALNGPMNRVSAKLFGRVIKETLLKGEAASRPVLAVRTLSAALIDPAIDFVRKGGGEVRSGARAAAIETGNGRATALIFAGGERIDLGAGDAVILAVPAWRVGALVPGVEAPPPGATILNVHYRLARVEEDPSFLGVVGGTVDWIFRRGDVVSVTVSDADALSADGNASLAERLWPDVSRALGIAGRPGRARVIKERRATFDQAPASLALRPGPRSPIKGVFLAGDWTNTGLPATLEGAARSGVAAAETVPR